MSGSMVSAAALPHKSAQEVASFDSGQSAGTESGLQAQTRVPEGSAQQQLDTLFAAAKPDSIIGAESIEARSADGIQLQMLQSSTSSDMHLETMLRGVQADASSASFTSSACQQDAMTASRAASGLEASSLGASAIQLISMADSAKSEGLSPEPDLARTEPEPNGPEHQLLSPAPHSLSPAPQPLSPVPLSLSTESQALSSAPQSLTVETQSLSSEPHLLSMEPDDHQLPATPAADIQPGLDAAAQQLTVGTSMAQQQDGQTEAMALRGCISPSIAQQDTGPDAADTGQVAKSAPDSIFKSGSSSSSSRAGSIGSSESLSQEKYLLAAHSSMAQVENPSVAQAALLVDSRIFGRMGSSVLWTSKAVGSTSRNMEDMAQTPGRSTAELQSHPDSSNGLDNSIGSMPAVDQRQSEYADAQDATGASDATDSGHASPVGGGFLGNGDQELTVAVLQAKGDLNSAMLQRFHTGARLP